MTSPLDARLEPSYRWIREHWNAFNVDVPDQLLHEWTHSEDPEGPPPAGFHLAVFTFGYLQHRVMEGRTSHETRSVCATKILELYYHWQVKLALAQVDRSTDVRTSALRLFAFSEDEEVEVMLRGDEKT